MSIDKKTINRLDAQDLRLGEKYLWLALKAEQQEDDGFCHMDQPTWADKLRISTKYLRTFLKNLESRHLIERDYRSYDAGNGYTGNRLFVKAKQLETEENMIFFGTFAGIDQSLKMACSLAVFKNVKNTDCTISLSYAFSGLNPNDYNTKALANIEVGDLVKFNASLSRTTKGVSIKKIWNIRPLEQFND